MDWDVVNIDTLVETEVPTMEKRKSKFYNDYLEKINIISPWYRNILPIQVIIWNRQIILDFDECINLINLTTVNNFTCFMFLKTFFT